MKPHVIAVLLSFCLAPLVSAQTNPSDTFFTDVGSTFVDQNDCIWVDQGAQGGSLGGPYETDQANCEDYSTERWERPVADNKWEDVAGGIRRQIRTPNPNSGGIYYSYVDLNNAKVGASADWLIVQFTSYSFIKLGYNVIIPLCFHNSKT